MAKTNDIQNTYGKTISVAIANTNLETVLNAYGLPKNSIIINSEYDSINETDIGNSSMIVTDYEGTPAVITRNIEEKNGLHSDTSNPNLIYMHIDNSTITTDSNESLSIDLNKVVDNKTLVVDNNKIDIDTSSLDKASKTKFGVVKVDNNTIISDNGILHVVTNKLDYANNNIVGVAKGDNTTIMTNNGILSVNTENIQKASDITYGVVKPDNVTISSNNGTLSVNITGVASLDDNGFGLNKADNNSIIQNNGVLSINENNLPKATDLVAGVVKIDPNSLETNSDILQVKGYSNTMTYIYDLQTGISTVEQKIAYIRNFLDNNQYQGNVSTISHLSCNETTTTMLAPPESMEEPINMPIQHVYVSLNVITNCDFSIDIDYENNETPTIELDNINYNDEYHLQGIEALEHTWESTNMQEKNVILLFNCKNFLSSTGPKTKITKLNITISAKDNSNEYKSIIYSVIRYNSYFINEEPEPEPEPEYTAEYIVDESQSKWIISNVMELDNVKDYEEGGMQYPDGTKYAYLTDPDDKSIIDIHDVLSDSNNKLFLVGAYTNVKTKETKRFYVRLNTDTFIVNITGKYVYDYSCKIKFDTLYYKIRYYNTAPEILFGNNRSIEIRHQFYKDCPKIGEIPYNVSCENVASFLKINNEIIAGNYANNSYMFMNDDNEYIELAVEDNIISYTSYIVKYNEKLANIYLVNTEYIPANVSINKINFDTLYDNGYAGKITLTVGTEKYETMSYLYMNDQTGQVKNEFEFIYGETNGNFPTNIYLYAEKRYANRAEAYSQESNINIHYITEYYSLKDNNIDFKYNDLTPYVPNEPVFDLVNENYDITNTIDSYCFTLSYNVFMYDENINTYIPYYDSYSTVSFMITPTSVPEISLTGGTISQDGNNVSIIFSDKILNKVYSINGNTNIDDLVDSITISYSYVINGELSTISFAEDSSNYSSLKVDCSNIEGSYSIKAIGISGSVIHKYEGHSIDAVSYEFNVDNYKDDDILLIYAYETTNENNHSNVIGDFVLSSNMPKFDLVKASPVFVDNNSLYAYYEVNCPKYGRNSVSQLEIAFGDSYISQNTYYKHALTGSESYSEKYLYNLYIVTDSYQFVDNCSTPAIRFEFTSGYTDSVSNKAIFTIGTTNSDITQASLNATVAYIIDNQQHIYDLSIVKHNDSILGIIDEATDFTGAEHIFVTASGYCDLTYYNSYVANITYENGVFGTSSSNENSFYDDAIKTLAYSMFNVNGLAINDSDMKLEIYNGKQLTYTIVALANDTLTVNGERTSTNNMSSVGLLKLISIESTRTSNNMGANAHQQQTIEVPITYIYNIPNLSSGFDQYCHCDIYRDYFVARFNKPYDKFFTPYDYTIVAHINGKTTDILNKQVYFVDEYDGRPKTIKVVFEVKYKDSVIFTKTISVNKANNLDGITYLVSDYSTEKTSSSQLKTTYFAYSYYTYSTNLNYTYGDIFTYIDTSHYENQVFCKKCSEGIKRGLLTVPIESGEYELTKSNETIVPDSITYYLTKFDDNENISYVWQFSEYDEYDAATFRLCEFGDNKLEILPALKKDYTMNKINIL